MAALCPCGCGRKLSLLERGMGKQARMVGDRIEFLEQYTVPLELEPKEDLEDFIAEGREIGGNLIAVIHGELPADAFDRGSMNRWLQLAHKMELGTKTALHKAHKGG